MCRPDFLTVDALLRPPGGRIRWRRYLRRGRLFEFVCNNLHAANWAAHHPGHRGSIDISAQLPYEHTSIRLWKTCNPQFPEARRPGA